MTDLAIEATGLTKAYRSVRVLRGVDLAVRRGTVFALLGPNGAGKTTAVRILTTLTGADAGHARVAGFDVARQRHEVRRVISLTGQFAAVDGLQTGEEYLRMMARLTGLRGAAARCRAAELVERFELGEVARRTAATYSGGLRRRLDLAAGLAGRPEVIFLDEPTTGLDPRGRLAMWAVVAEQVSAGVTVFLTTQYLHEADESAQRIAVMAGGRVVAEGTPADLKRRFGQQRLDLTLAGPAAYHAALRRLGARAALHDESRLLLGVPTDGAAAGVRALLDELDPGRTDVASFAVRSATLDDVFHALTKTSPTADSLSAQDMEAAHG